MTKIEMNEIVKNNLKAMETYSESLKDCIDMLKRTLANGDSNFSALESIDRVIKAEDSNMKTLALGIRKALGQRAKARLKELGAFQ